MEIDERGWIVISGPLDCVNNVIVVVAPKISHGAETRRHHNHDRSILRETANREREREREPKANLDLQIQSFPLQRERSPFVFKIRPIETTFFIFPRIQRLKSSWKGVLNATGTS